MIRPTSILALCSALSTQVTPPRNQRIGTDQVKRSEDSQLIIATPNQTEKGMAAILDVARSNHLPTGLVIDLDEDSALCKSSIAFSRQKLTVAELIAELNAGIPNYRATFQDGTLTIRTFKPPKLALDLLSMRVPEYRSGPTTQFEMSLSLWSSVHGQIAPLEGTAYAGGAPLAADIVNGVDAKNMTVEQILNTLVKRGNGGVWIVAARHTDTLGPSTPMPFDVFSYGSKGDLRLVHDPCTETAQGQ